ncbi:hypothetical protein LTR97_010856 [Elasticomyces elasticus]|uniref:BTB domain-containing protein n=1 Tax=Elasticomyces elasticus TaxID=574655 RepID=A0AAN7VN94_9PEZI|nr:hypothetical protein LTR97_010856 [Elasticomyces elasticus]
MEPVDIDPQGDVMICCGTGIGTNEKKFIRASSAVLSGASSVFKVKFQEPEFTEAYQRPDLYPSGWVGLARYEDDSKAMEIMCEVLHHRHTRVPESAEGQEELVANVAELCDKYDCVDALLPTARGWLAPIKGTENTTARRHLMTAAYYFRDDKAFYMYGHWLLRNAYDAIDRPAIWSPELDAGNHVLRVVFGLLEAERNWAIRAITNACSQFVAGRSWVHYTQPVCAENCIITEQANMIAMVELFAFYQDPAFTTPIATMLDAMRRFPDRCEPCLAADCAESAQCRHPNMTTDYLPTQAEVIEKGLKVPCMGCLEERKPYWEVCENHVDQVGHVEDHEDDEEDGD